MREEDFRERKQLEEVVAKIDGDVDAVVVEGFSDSLAIRRLGFEGRIFQSAERKVEDLVEDVARSSDRVAVLTDFDSHGKDQNQKISRALEQKVDVIRSARKEFGAQLTSKDRRAVEDVKPLFNDRQQKFVDAALDTLYFRD